MDSCANNLLKYMGKYISHHCIEPTVEPALASSPGVSFALKFESEEPPTDDTSDHAVVLPFSCLPRRLSLRSRHGHQPDHGGNLRLFKCPTLRLGRRMVLDTRPHCWPWMRRHRFALPPQPLSHSETLRSVTPRSFLVDGKLHQEDRRPCSRPGHRLRARCHPEVAADHHTPFTPCSDHAPSLITAVLGLIRLWSFMDAVTLSFSLPSLGISIGFGITAFWCPPTLLLSRSSSSQLAQPYPQAVSF